MSTSTPRTPGTVQTVGQFTFDSATSTVSGPSDYMREQGNARLARILSGTDVVFNMGYEYQKDIPTLLLVTLQTDYAGWHGLKTLGMGGRS